MTIPSERSDPAAPPARVGPAPASAPRRPAAWRSIPSRRAPLTDAELTALIDTEQGRARGLCEQALAQTPEAYRSFIILIAQRKNLGDRENPVWAQIQLPYMTVDGRVRMARDEHKAAGKRIDIPAESAYVEDPVTKQLLAKVTVRSELYGSATAHARVFLSGGGPHETNPLETAETSAVGRALGFLGYGCFGTGIASADEVLRALRTPENGGLPARASESPGPAAAPASGQPPKPTAPAPTNGAASAPGYQRGDFLRLANELDVSTMAYVAFLRKEYGVGHPGDLTDEPAARESERFVIRKRDPRSAKKFRSVCQRLASSASETPPGAGPQ